MGNYLNHLVGKALNYEPSIQPRRASLFAPTPYVSGALGKTGASPFTSPLGFEEESATRLRQSEHDRRDPHPSPSAAPTDEETRTPDVRPRARTHQARPETSLSETHAETVNVPSAPHPSPSAPAIQPLRQTAPSQTIYAPRLNETPKHSETPHDAHSTRDDRDAERFAARSETLRPNVSAVSEADARSTSETLDALRRRLARDEQEAGQLEDALTRARATLQSERAAEANRERLAAEKARALESASRRLSPHRDANAEASSARATQGRAATGINSVPRIVPARSSVLPSTQPARQETTGETHAPTIQVTIGRIEVRAAPPSTASRKSAAASSPRMTLDEYLRRRSGGKQ